MKNIIILLLISCSAFGQRPDTKFLKLHGDTLYIMNATTGDSTQINKVSASVTSQSIITALGYTPLSTNRYIIPVQALTSSPTDAQTVYFGMLPKAPIATANVSKVYIRRSGTITGAEIYCYSGTAGTAESWSISIRKNNTTDFLIAAVAASASERVFTNQSLSIPVVAGDYIEIKSVNPTWVTNPLTTIFGGYIIIE